MAEMTAAEAIDFLKRHDYNCDTCFKIAALIEQQAAEIERLQGQASFDGSQIAEYEAMVRVQAAAIAKAYENMKGDFQHYAYCELIDSPPGKKCTCGVWEMVSAIENADAGSTILAENKRMREALEEIAGLQRKENYIHFGVHVACKYANAALHPAEQGAPFGDDTCFNPDKEVKS